MKTIKAILFGMLVAGAVSASEKTALHFERIAAGVAEEGFDIHCGKPAAGKCEVVMVNHGQAQETATVAETEAKQWIEKFAGATKSLSEKRGGTAVISVRYMLNGKTVQADLTTEDRKPGGENPLARAFVALEEKLRATVSANP